MVFVFDTNSLSVLKNYYPERFPTFWSHFDGAIASGTVVYVREVCNEIQKIGNSQWLLDWVQQHRDIFLTPSTAETEFVAEIFRVPHFRNLVSERQRLAGSVVADPFVIACARVQEGCVITEEAFRPNAARIPNVCQHFGIDCTNFEGFLDRMGWEF